MLCIEVLALEGVVVSAASHLDDFVEASAVTKNHNALDSAFHSLRVARTSLKFFRLLILPVTLTVFPPKSDCVVSEIV